MNSTEYQKHVSVCGWVIFEVFAIHQIVKGLLAGTRLPGFKRKIQTGNSRLLTVVRIIVLQVRWCLLYIDVSRLFASWTPGFVLHCCTRNNRMSVMFCPFLIERYAGLRIREAAFFGDIAKRWASYLAWFISVT